MTVNEGYVLYSAKLEREDKFLAIGARGPVFAPAKPAFPPSMAVAEPRISCHIVAAKPACKAGIHQSAKSRHAVTARPAVKPANRLPEPQQRCTLPEIVKSSSHARLVIFPHPGGRIIPVLESRTAGQVTGPGAG